LTIDLFDRDSLVIIPIYDQVTSTVNLLRGDTLVIYADFDASFRSDDKTILGRVHLIGNSVTIDSIVYSLPHLNLYRYIEGYHQKVKFHKSGTGAPDGLILEKHMRYYEFSMGGLEYITNDFSTTLLIDLDDLGVNSELSFASAEPGQFSADSLLQYVGCQMVYLDFKNPTDSGFVMVSVVAITDTNGNTDFQVNLPYEQPWFAVGDVSPDHPYDEVIYYSRNSGLNAAHPPAIYNLACYNFSSGNAQEIWYQPMAGIIPSSYFEAANVIAAWRGDSTLLFIDAGTGETLDSVAFGFHIAIRVAFSVSDNLPLHAAACVNDTVFVYRFDAITDVDDSEPSLPSGFTLSQNYPNPFNASTEIRFSLARAGEITLTIYNLLGQEVRTIASGRYAAGEHRLSWDGTDHAENPCASGLYLYRLATDYSIQAKKMLLLK
jgi:hypothetical protein